MVSFTMRLGEELVAAVDEEAVRNGLSRAGYVRMVLTQAVGGEIGFRNDITEEVPKKEKKSEVKPAVGYSKEDQVKWKKVKKDKL